MTTPERTPSGSFHVAPLLPRLAQARQNTRDARLAKTLTDRQLAAHLPHVLTEPNPVELLKLLLPELAARLERADGGPTDGNVAAVAAASRIPGVAPTTFIRARLGAPTDLTPLGPKGLAAPSVGAPCRACGVPFKGGELTVIVPLGPGTDPDAQWKAAAGGEFSAVGAEVHYVCGTGKVKP